MAKSRASTLISAICCPTDVELEPLERFAFYDAAKQDSCCLVIATGEQRIYANILLTIGVVAPPADQAV